MTLSEIFQSKAQHLSWGSVENVMGGAAPSTIEKGEAYFVLRLKEMYVVYSRKLWRKYYPMLYSFTAHGEQQENAVVGPGQLRELGNGNFERIINLNQRLAGPMVYTGEDLSLLVGLYSVPGEDAAKALIETVSTFAALGGLTAKPTIEIANAIKGGVERIIGLNDSRLQLGVRDTFNAGQPLRSGPRVGLSAPAGSVDYAKLWLKNGRLHQGDNPLTARPYEDHDYMVIEIERRDTREDWPGLPGLAEFQERFAVIMADGSLTAAERRKRVGEIWPGFQQALQSSNLLIKADKEGIAHSVSQDLLKRLDALAGNNPFVETRSWGERVVQKQSPTQFDFAEVPAYTDRTNRDSVRQAVEALSGQPFA